MNYREEIEKVVRHVASEHLSCISDAVSAINDFIADAEECPICLRATDDEDEVIHAEGCLVRQMATLLVLSANRIFRNGKDLDDIRAKTLDISFGEMAHDFRTTLQITNALIEGQEKLLQTSEAFAHNPSDRNKRLFLMTLQILESDLERKREAIENSLL